VLNDRRDHVHRRLRAVTVVMAVSSLAVGLAACSSASGGSPGGSGTSSATAKDVKLAGVAPYASDPYWISLMCGATREAKAQGVTMKWYAANNTDTAAEQQNLQAAMLTKPDGMIIGSIDPANFATQTGTLMQGGTPVISVDGPMTPPTELKQIASATDVSEFADLIASQVGDTGSFGVLGGQPAIPPAEARWKPVVAAVAAKNPNIKILPTQYDNFDRNKAAQVTSALIVAHPDLKAVYAIAGPEGEGAAAAVKQAGKQGQIKVYAYDATPGEVEYLKSGDIVALISQPAGNEGSESVKHLLSFLQTHKGGAIQPESPLEQDLPLMVLTKDNIDSPEAQPYLYKATCDA
jgi:ABC-type sugar transport system substrate-binding protein